MDLRKIKKLIELVEESGLSELEVRNGEESVRIARPVAPPGGAPTAAQAQPGAAAQPAAVQPPARQSAGAAVRAPMAGTFYQAPQPDAEPFVRIGRRVEAGDVLCIIESMKMMNEITADTGGLCTAIEVANGEAVSSGQILFRLG